MNNKQKELVNKYELYQQYRRILEEEKNNVDEQYKEVIDNNISEYIHKLEAIKMELQIENLRIKYKKQQITKEEFHDQNKRLLITKEVLNLNLKTKSIAI